MATSGKPIVGKIDAKLARALLPRRDERGDKWSHGCALLVAGSRGMCGAASFAARAAFRCGLGYLKLAAPESESAVLQILAPDAVLVPCRGADGRLALSDAPGILDAGARCAAWAAGPGLSAAPGTARLVRKLVRAMRAPGILDADGLKAFAGRADLLARGNCGADLVLTPHAREWELLFGAPLPEGGPARRRAIREHAVALDQTLVAKGSATIVAAPDGGLRVLDAPCSALAKAGSGDALAGAVLAFLAQGLEPPEAAALAVWLHNRAGHLGAKRFGEQGILPRELPDLLGEAIVGLGIRS